LNIHFHSGSYGIFPSLNKFRFFRFSRLNSPPGSDPEATYKFVEVIEVPTDEIEQQEVEEEDTMDLGDDLSAVNDANWPPPIPINGPNSDNSLNMKGLLNTIPNKWLDNDKKSAYTKDFGTFVGRLMPLAHGISGLVTLHRGSFCLFTFHSSFYGLKN